MASETTIELASRGWNLTHDELTLISLFRCLGPASRQALLIALHAECACNTSPGRHGQASLGKKGRPPGEDEQMEETTQFTPVNELIEIPDAAVDRAVRRAIAQALTTVSTELQASLEKERRSHG